MATESAWDVHEGVAFPRGYRVEITDGRIIMTPQGENQSDVILEVAPQIKAQLAGQGRVFFDVMVDFPSSLYGYAPDITIVAPGAEHNSRGRYEWHDLEAVLEVELRARQDGDFVKKLNFYAECAIPLYVVIDPSSALCTIHSSPQPEGVYAVSEVVPFGENLVLPLEGREIVIDTKGFPRD
ncbi:Uma2 family endonuclease [Kitasatospora kifunensis]|nr:Uma2 family endonuclease [Kitasatospora kifunensis]